MNTPGRMGGALSNTGCVREQKVVQQYQFLGLLESPPPWEGVWALKRQQDHSRYVKQDVGLHPLTTSHPFTQFFLHSSPNTGKTKFRQNCPECRSIAWRKPWSAQIICYPCFCCKLCHVEVEEQDCSDEALPELSCPLGTQGQCALCQ